MTTATPVDAPDAMDFFCVRGLLDEDEQAIQDAVARFVDDRVIPLVADAFEQGQFPKELIPEIAEMGLLGCNIDGYECGGLSHVCYGLVNQELERGDAGIRSFVSVQGSLCMYPIYTYGSEEQKQR
ncbi:MAG: acyl-CoA dehydrogenase family protein, partial [Phycisphaerales bacterium]|nr:acyl-CoA dehydrogenase family protein [Phycisphaerales bacterium]